MVVLIMMVMVMMMIMILTEKPEALPLLHAEAQAPHGALGALVGRGHGRRVHLRGENSTQDTTYDVRKMAAQRRGGGRRLVNVNSFLVSTTLLERTGISMLRGESRRALPSELVRGTSPECSAECSERKND